MNLKGFRQFVLFYFFLSNFIQAIGQLLNLPEHSIREASYIIIASRVIRPAEKFQISCTILNKNWDHSTVKATIFTPEQEIVSGMQELQTNMPNTIPMKLPNTLRPDTYYLKLDGYLSTGELLFSNKSELLFEQKAVSIIIQLERPDYRHESILRFRCIPIYPDLSGYYGTMDVLLIAPQGFIIRRWQNIQTNAGVASLSYTINDAPPDGTWTIKAIVMGYEATKQFDVIEFYQWKYEVNVSMPHYFLTTSPGVAGVVVANYTTGRGVFGNCRIKAYVKNNTVNVEDIEEYPHLEIFYDVYDGVIDFFFPMEDILKISGAVSLNELEVYVEAQVEDPLFNGDLSNGSFITTLYDPKIELKFLGKTPRAFKAKMPYTTHVSIAQQDGTPISSPNMFVKFKIEMNDGSSLNEQPIIPIGEESIVSYSFTPDSAVEFISITATLIIGDYEDSSTTITERAIRYKSKSNSFIYISSSTVNPQVGDYMIFTIRASQPTDFVYYHIVSSSRIIYTNILKMNHKQKTFDVGITREMAPSAHMVAYFIRDDGEMVSDSYNFHVDASAVQNKVNITINKRKDFTGDTIEILAYASPQSMVCIAALDESIVRLYDGGNIITELMLYDELYSFDLNSNTSFTQTWNSELGFPSRRVFFPSQSYAYDVSTTFSYTGLLMFTDLPIIKDEIHCNSSEGFFNCLDGKSCYQENEKCDETCHCKFDCVDESNCEKEPRFFRPLHERFTPKIERLYQLSWLWKDQYSLPDGRVQFVAEVSKDIASYVVSAFAVSSLTGFGMIKQPAKISTTRQFYIQVLMPETSRLGEQIGVVVDVFNFQSQRIEALVILHPSEDYNFVNVEKDGLVSSFAPKLTTGYHHILLIIQPRSSRRINIPICPKKAGQIEVTIEALSGANRDTVVSPLMVLYEGITNIYHTPYLLSLVDKPRMITEFEIVTNETFILPLQQMWQYVPNSPTAKVSITGDVCGPFFFLGIDEFMSTDNYLNHISLAPVEAGLFSFGTHIYNLMYMRQGHGGKYFDLEKMLRIIDWLNFEYQRIMICYVDKGFFNQYCVDDTDSTWLTSWALIVLKDGIDPIWELHGLFIDPAMINDAVTWLISQQDPVNGSFSEPLGLVSDRRFVSNYTVDWDGNLVQLNLSLTAQCLIGLKVNSDLRGGNASSIVSQAIIKARMYLEKHLTKITDAFERAIVTYALHVSNSPMKDIAFEILNKTKHKNDYGVYWSNWPIPQMKVYWPSKNPRQNWKPESIYEGHAVAATSYALLTIIMRAEHQNKFEIMKWLQTQRNHVGGMSSTYDTVLSHKALVLYAISTGDSIQNYNMNIVFSSSSSSDVELNHISIETENIIEYQEYDLENVWGNLLVDGQGTGYALVQLQVAYNVEYPWQIRRPPSYDAFNMSVQTHLFGRNFSIIDYHVCLSWLPQNVERFYTERSGHVQFEIQIPTGYRCEERALKDKIGVLRNLGDGENMPGQINWLFDYVDLDPICFTFRIERYVPVANLSRYYSMKMYEYHEPANANRSMYTLRDVFGLDICEVCGSYQCPYCPYYAYAVSFYQINKLALIISTIFVLRVIDF